MRAPGERWLALCLMLWALVSSSGCHREMNAPPGGTLIATPAVEMTLPGSPIGLATTEGRWVLAWEDPEHGSIEVWTSRDLGETWDASISVPEGIEYSFHPGVGDHHFLVRRDGEIHHLRRTPGEPPVVSGPVFRRGLTLAPPAFRNRAEMGVAGLETSGGWSQIVFARSPDHGRTWEAPRPVKGTRTRETVYGPLDLLGARAGWLVAWADARGRDTLFDVWASRSRDGTRWQGAVRINDDDAPAWQIHPSLAETGEGALVAFMDWREEDPYWGRSQSLYAARLAGSALKPTLNRRVSSESTANQGPGVLAGHRSAGLVGAAWIDQRHRLTGDVYATATQNGGGTWGGEICLSCDRRPALHNFSRDLLLTAAPEGFLAGWEEHWRGNRTVVLRSLKWSTDPEETGPATPPSPDASSEPEDPPPIEGRKTLLGSRSFDSSELDGWDRLTGSWIVREGQLLGFGATPSLLRWEGEPLRDFVLAGRFRLDPMQHHRVYWYFRTEGDDPGALRGLTVFGQFREGFFLQRIEGGYTGSWDDPVRPLADRRFPLLQDVWYPFRLRVLGEQMELWVAERRVLAFAGLSGDTGTGLILGTGRTPVAFDDLVLHRLETPAVSRD